MPDRRRPLALLSARSPVGPRLFLLLLNLKSERQHAPVLRLTDRYQPDTQIRFLVDFLQGPINRALFQVRPMNQALLAHNISLCVANLIDSQHLAQLRDRNTLKIDVPPFPRPLIKTDRVFARELDGRSLGILLLMSLEALQMPVQSGINMKNHLLIHGRYGAQPPSIEDGVLFVPVV